MSVPGVIYKICRTAEWEALLRDGVFHGSQADRRDGYIHFSSAEQLIDTAEKHFAEEGDFILVAVPTAALGPALKFELSRGGALFPHLYGTLPASAVRWAKPLPADAAARHRLLTSLDVS